jgi:preprotein translocase subunit SecE
VARNRKRAKERRARRPQTVSARTREQSSERSGAPNPLEHAAPDAEIARAAEIPPDFAPEIESGLADEEGFEEDGAYEEDDTDLEAELEKEELESEAAGEGPPPDELPEGPLGEDDGDRSPVRDRRARSGNRLLTFLEGSWRELQRVQWPDRRQVMQATGVVIGFVIVAGVFLGLADFVSEHLVSFIINGHY